MSSAGRDIYLSTQLSGSFTQGLWEVTVTDGPMPYGNNGLELFITVEYDGETLETDPDWIFIEPPWEPGTDPLASFKSLIISALQAHTGLS